MAKRGRQPAIAIIGAGLSGMCMAIKLRETGYSKVTIYEKADKVGGTWRENTYPGVACDVPSHLYSFSFASKSDWSQVYSPGSEIQQYCEDIAATFDLEAHLCCGHELVGADYNVGTWSLTFSEGQTAQVDYLISCVGGLHIPNYPEIEGREAFQGAMFHSADWDHSYDLTGNKVAVIGTAASALQFIPKIVDQVGQLDVYQRTPNWVMPRAVGTYSKRTKWLFVRMPFLAKLLRLWIYLLHEMRVPLFRGNGFLAKRAEKMALKHLTNQVEDEGLRETLTPTYPIGCKRILASDDYFPALQQDHVSLVTEGIEAITPEGVKDTSGQVRPVDTIIYATGFKPFDVAGQMEVVGRGGQKLADYMQAGIRAHRTVALPGFPNYFTMLGPNSGLGHNSIILVIEAQAKYIVQAIRYATTKGHNSVEARMEVTDAFNSKLQGQFKGTVWAGQCQSWYKDEAGFIFTLWPRGTVNFRRALAKFDPEEYAFDV